MTSKATSLSCGVLIGIVFGFALEKCKVYVPLLIQQQMLMLNFTMLKAFLTAAATATVVLFVLNELRVIQITPRASATLGFVYGGNVIGGLLLGAGMTISGSCPGTVFVQVGAGMPNAWFGVLGGLCGALVFGYAYNLIPLGKGEFKGFENLFGSRLFSTSVFVGVLMLVVMSAEHFRSWTQDSHSFLESSHPSSLLTLDLSSPTWSPIQSGLLIGLLQLPSLLLAQCQMGTSSAYCALVGHTVSQIHKETEKTAPYFTKFNTPADIFQVGTVFGITLGAFLSLYLSGMAFAYDTLGGVTSARNMFLGCFVMIIGARTAGGCTSGHGISGLAQLSLASAVSVACMFAGGMTTAFLLR